MRHKYPSTCRHLASVNASLVSKNQLLAAEVERLEKMNTELSQVQ